MNVTLIQTEIFWENRLKNLEHFNTLINSVNELTDLIILPEMFTTGFTMNPETLAEPSNGETLTWLKEKAAKKNCVLTGSVSVEENGKFYNRLFWVKPDGNFQTYDKRHLFRMAKEEQHYTAGDKKIITELGDWKICPLICYDLRFPVWSRNRFIKDDGKGKMEDGKRMMEEGKGKREEGKGKREEGKRMVEKGEGKREEGKRMVEKGEGKREDGKRMMEKGKGKREDGKRMVEKGKGKREEGKRMMEDGEASGWEYDVLIYVANWPEVRSYPWKQLLIARAIENQCYVIGLNRIGEDGTGFTHSGDSVVINPRGEIISKTKANEEHIETVTLDKSYLDEFRKIFPVGLDADDFTAI
jgi:predicted amidohydrolase